MTRYVKAPKWLGKDLILQVGRGDMRIADTGVYDDARLAKFVGMGFVVEAPEKKPAPVAPVATPKAETKPVPAAPVATPKAEKAATSRAPVDPVTKSGNVIPGSSKRVSKDKQGVEPKAGGDKGGRKATAGSLEPEAPAKTVAPEDAVTEVSAVIENQGDGPVDPGAPPGNASTVAAGEGGDGGDGNRQGGE